MQYTPRALSRGAFSNIVVAIAQLVEPRIVIPVVEGSSPFSHPIHFVIGNIKNIGD